MQWSTCKERKLRKIDSCSVTTAATTTKKNLQPPPSIDPDSACRAKPIKITRFGWRKRDNTWRNRESLRFRWWNCLSWNQGRIYTKKHIFIYNRICAGKKNCMISSWNPHQSWSTSPSLSIFRKGSWTSSSKPASSGMWSTWTGQFAHWNLAQSFMIAVRSAKQDK